MGVSLGQESMMPQAGEHMAPLTLTMVMLTSSAEHFPCYRADYSAADERQKQTERTATEE